MWKNKQKQKETTEVEPEVPQMNIRNILKDIEFLGSSHSTWKERKEMENRKVVSLGGKPPKKQRLPLSVAKVVMKKQKEREEKISQEDLILGRFKPRFASDSGRSMEKYTPEKRVLKSTEGNFRNGVLDVKHMLHRAPPREDNGGDRGFNGGKRKGGGKKSFKGKKKGGGKKQGGGGGGRGKKRH